MANNNYKKHVENWESQFIKRYSKSTSSNKEVLFKSACDNLTDPIEPLDKLMIEHKKFISQNSIKYNDIFKYYHAYKNNKIKLNPYFFSYCPTILDDLYNKIDNSDGNSSYSFSQIAWEKYVLFVMLKYYGLYEKKHDKIFDVKYIDGREYNPATSITKYFRSILPNSITITEYDIRRANPSFIDLELGIKNREEDIYNIIDKENFNKLINSHIGNGIPIEKVKSQLKKVYGEKVDEVITNERFNSKGKMFKDLAKYEETFINKFIIENRLENYYRIHDCIVTSSNKKIEKSVFENIQFVEKKVEKMEKINQKRNFYIIDEKGKVVTTPSTYMHFFKQENFKRVSNNDDTIFLINNNNGILEPFKHKTEIIAYLKKFVNEVNEENVINRLAYDLKNITGGILLLESENLEYFKDGPNDFTLTFKNGQYSISKDNLTIIKTKTSITNGFILKHPKIHDFEFKPPLDYEVSEFERFLNMVYLGFDSNERERTERENEKILEIFTMIGYMCHNYKNPSNVCSIVLTDEDADNINRNGGRGKSLILEALKYVRTHLIKVGNEFRTDYTHKFDDLNEGIDIFMIDDPPLNFDYDDFFPNITAGISSHKKGKSAVYIPFENSPKFIFATNFPPLFRGVSQIRRYETYFLKSYFNLQNKPYKVFGHNLFIDWDSNEWNRFYHFIFKCAGLFIKHGLKTPLYDRNEIEFKNYFSNEIVLEEFERIFNEKIKDTARGFSAGEFMDFYLQNSNMLQKEKLFNIRTIKFHIDCYINYHNLNVRYVKSKKRWFKM